MALLPFRSQRRTIAFLLLLCLLSILAYFHVADVFAPLDQKFSFGKSSRLNEKNITLFKSASSSSLASEFNTTLFPPSKPGIPVEELFETVFPQCRLPTMYDDEEDVHAVKTKASVVEKWVRWVNDTTATSNNPRIRHVLSESSPRYDHLSCGVMKARYNCAMPPNYHGEQAFDYKMIWRNFNGDSNETKKWCDLHSFVEHTKGLAGLVGRHPSSQQRHILMQGNSYLRQVWEALVCGFSSQITNLTLWTHGPPTSLAYIASRSGKPLQRQELGRFFNVDASQIPTFPQRGCHGPTGKSPMEDKYRNVFNSNVTQNVTVPPTIPKCTDDMAMVEFHHSIRFYFLFHPSRYHEDALMEIYRQLGVPSTVDVKVWMDPEEETLRNRNARVTWSWDHNILPLLVAAQQDPQASATHGRYFGADNPWITHPPDNHPCMPGIPDDEVNLFLYFLLLEEYQSSKGNRG